MREENQSLEDVRMEAEVREKEDAAAFEAEGRGHGPRTVGGF